MRNVDNRASRSTRVGKYRQSLSSENIGQVSGCAMASYSSGMRRHRTGTAMAPRVRSATPSPTGCHFGAPAQAGIEHNVLHQGEAVGAQAAFSACGAGRRPRPIIQEDDRGHHSPSTSQQPRIAFQCLIGSNPVAVCRRDRKSCTAKESPTVGTVKGVGGVVTRQPHNATALPFCSPCSEVDKVFRPMS